MNLLKQKIKQHKKAIFISFLVALVYFAPHFYFVNFSANYAGLQFKVLDSEVHYMARIMEASEGHYNYASTYFYEYKNEPSIMLQYSELIFGLLLKFLGLPIGFYFLMLKLIFPAINFLLWYAFSFLLLSSKRWAIFSSLLLMFGYSIRGNLDVTNQWKILTWGAENVDILTYGRIVNPLLTFSFFFIALIFLFLFFRYDKLKYAIIFGVTLGVSFYIYFYYWFFLCALSGVILVYFIFRKKKDSFIKLFIGLGPAVVIGAYFIISIYQVAFRENLEGSSGGALSVYEATNQFVFSMLVILTLLLFSTFLFYKYKKKEEISTSEIFVLLALVTSILVVNQQVITGRLVEEGHFHWYTNLPMVFLAFVIIFKYWWQKIDSVIVKNFIYYFFIAYLFLYGIGSQASGYINQYQEFEGKQKYMVVFNWLIDNSAKESVVFANGPISNNIAAYTNNNVYYAEYSKHYATTPIDRRINAFFTYYYLDQGAIECNNIDPDLFLGYTRDWVYFRYTRDGETTVPAGIIKAIEEACFDYEKLSFYDILNEYRLDYVVWDKQANPQWRMDEFDFLEGIIENEEVVLYKFLKK